MKINETTTSQSRNIRRIGTWLPMATFALGVCCAIQSASAAVQVTVPGEVPGIPAYAQFGYDPVIGANFILHDEKWGGHPVLSRSGLCASGL